MSKFSENLKRYIKLWALGLLLAAAVFVITNWNFFWTNAGYFFAPPYPPVVTIEPAQPVVDAPTPAPAPVPSASSSTQSPKYDPAGTLIIDSLGLKLPVMNVYETSERAFQAALIDGVVHYPNTAAPGQVGNDYIFGHSSDYIWSKGHYKTAFALLPKIKIGATVQLSDLTGKFYTYKVFATKIVSPTDTSVLQQNTGGKKILTLQTSYPVGTALKRFLAIAELVQ